MKESLKERIKMEWTYDDWLIRKWEEDSEEEFNARWREEHEEDE